MTPAAHAAWAATPGAWHQARRDALDAEIAGVCDGPARRIIDALTALPPHVAPGVVASLARSRSYTLSGIGEIILGDDDPGARAHDPVATLTRRLWFSVFIGDLQEVAPRLSATREPWATIRSALEAVDAGWHAVRPTGRTAHDREQ